MTKENDDMGTTDKSRSRTRTETDRDDKSVFGTVRENSDIGVEEAWSANIKRMYDEYQELSLASARRGQTHFDKMISDAQNMSTQIMQNAIESANMISKQAIAHRDLAIHHEWGAHEQVDDPRKE